MIRIVLLPVAVALIMVATHGFGLFLFGAIVPVLQADYGYSYSYVGLASGTLQIAYMVGALIIGSIGHRFAPRYWLIGATCLCISLLLLLSTTVKEEHIIFIFALLGIGSAISWGSAVGVVNELLPKKYHGLVLTISASGGAWGMLTIGFLMENARAKIDVINFWSIGAVLGLIGLVVILFLLNKPVGDEHSSSAGQDDSQPGEISTPQTRRVAYISIMLAGLLGATAVPFTTYLSSYLVDEVGRSIDVASSIWQVLGFTGAVSGFVIGWLSNRLDKRHIMHLTFAAFAISCLYLAFQPTSSYVSMVGVGHGVILNPFWGLIAAYIGQFFSPTSTMRLASLGLTAFGLCSAVANWCIGQWAGYGGEFSTVYTALGVLCILMSVLLLATPSVEKLKLGKRIHEKTV